MTRTNESRYVLLVDDHDDSRELLSEFLGISGFAIESRASGEEALDCVRSRGAPQVVVTDLSLGSMNGVDLAKKIREALAKPALPIVAVTGHASFDNSEGVFAQILVKPVSLDRLRDVLNELAG